MATQVRPSVRVLVLATSSAAATLRWGPRLRHRLPDAEILFGIPEVDERIYLDAGAQFERLGENELDLDRTEVRQRIHDLDIDLVVIPLGFPLKPSFYVARWIETVPDDLPALGWVGGLIAGRGRVRRLLRVHTILAYGPLHPFYWLLSRCDGLFVLAGLAAARACPAVRPSPSRGIRTCHVITNLRVGGAQKQVTSFLRSTTRKGHALVALAQAPESVVAPLRTEGIEISVLSDSFTASTLGNGALRFLPRTTSLLLLLRHFRSTRPDVVVNWLFIANVLGAGAARLAGVPYVISNVRNLSGWKTWPNYRAWWYRRADRMAARLNDLVTGNAEAVVDDFVTWSKMDPGKTAVLHNGIDLDWFNDVPETADVRRQLGLDTKEFVLLTVGRLAAEKRQGIALHWLRGVIDRGVPAHLVIVGDGGEHGPLVTRAEQLDLTDRVTFVRGVRDSRPYYRAADVFLLTSSIEGLPNVVLEAQLAGLPAVTTPSGGTQEIVEDGVTGAIVPADDPERAVDAIIELLMDPGKRHRQGDAGRDRIREYFGMERFVERVDGLIDSLTKAPETQEPGDQPY